jgi:hypothetical protein
MRLGRFMGGKKIEVEKSLYVGTRVGSAVNASFACGAQCDVEEARQGTMTGGEIRYRQLEDHRKLG